VSENIIKGVRKSGGSKMSTLLRWELRGKKRGKRNSDSLVAAEDRLGLELRKKIEVSCTTTSTVGDKRRKIITAADYRL